VVEAGVIGVPDAKAGESVHAYVVAEDPVPSEAEIIAHCREHLTAYKVPRSVEYRDELPKSPVGKILRKDLRKELDATSGAAAGSGKA
jgi:long-chain acyl-CoA synthetase